MGTEKATGRDSDKIMLRVPDGMRERIAEAAKTAGRSMNAEIVLRLQDSFRGVDVDNAAETLRENQFLKDRTAGFERMLPVMQVMQEYLAATLVSAIDELPAGIRERYESVRGLASAVEKNEPRGISNGMLSLCRENSEFSKEIRQIVRNLEPAIAEKERLENLSVFREDGLQREKRPDPSKKLAPIGKIGREPSSSAQPTDKTGNDKGPVRRTGTKLPK